MTQRKPSGTTFTNWIDAQFKSAVTEGAFDNLPGSGKPLDLGDKNDPDWWLKKKLKDEGLALPLPPSLQVRKDREELLMRLQQVSSEREVRAKLALLNARPEGECHPHQRPMHGAGGAEHRAGRGPLEVRPPLNLGSTSPHIRAPGRLLAAPR